MDHPAPDATPRAAATGPAPTGGSTYVLRTGDAAVARLRVLDQLTWPTTSALLDRVGIAPGTSVLDAGCGPGLVTIRLAELTGAPTTGVDTDAVAIAHARAAADAAGVDVRFEHTAIEDHVPACGQHGATSAPDGVDLAYARFLLSHVSEPPVAMRHLVAATRPGGWVVAEDVHFPGHFCSPPNAAFDRYVALYEAASRARGANARLGVELPTLFRAAGLHDVGFDAHVPTFCGAEQRDGLRFAAMTLAGISDAVVDAGLVTRAEVDELVSELEAFADRDGTVMSMVRICQTWGRVPDPDAP